MKKLRTRCIPGSPFQHGRRLSGVEHQPQRKVRSWRVVRSWAIRLLYGNRESMNYAYHTLLEWVP